MFRKNLILLLILMLVFAGCESGSDSGPITPPDGDVESPDGDDDPDGIDGDPDGDADGDAEMDMDAEGEAEAEEMPDLHDSLLPPPPPPQSLGYSPAAREPAGTPPTPEEITAFTKKITGFFKESDYWNWVYRTNHGMHPSYRDGIFHYKLWWQDVGMRRDGDTIEFIHHGREENICKRTMKVMDNAIAGYLLTGDTRMGEVAAELMRGFVALSLGMEFEREDPVVKYLQSRAVFNQNHSYEVDGRKVRIDYEPMYTPSYKWNVHVFEIPDNPHFGEIWISNMRSKDDVAYIYSALPIATRAYYEAEDEAVREAAKLFIEYVRGFSQSIVDNDWFILTKYDDGEAVIAYDATKENNPPADLGSYVHWIDIFGPDAECTAQLGAAMAGYGRDEGKGDCEGGKIGWDFESYSTTTHYFNYNIYNYFHIAALATAQLWGYSETAKALNEGLAWRFDMLMHDPDLANRDHLEFDSDLAGWLLNAATHGYQLTAEEARHIMTWYGDSADWYLTFEHWDPWTSMEDGEELSDYRPPRHETLEGGGRGYTYVRPVEMPYIFEYCNSQWLHPDSTPFIDCAVVADPSQWGE